MSRRYWGHPGSQRQDPGTHVGGRGGTAQQGWKQVRLPEGGAGRGWSFLRDSLWLEEVGLAGGKTEGADDQGWAGRGRDCLRGVRRVKASKDGACWGTGSGWQRQGWQRAGLRARLAGGLAVGVWLLGVGLAGGGAGHCQAGR